MSARSASKATLASKQERVGRLFLLELSGGRIHALNADGSGGKVIVSDCQLPDGIAVDTEAGHIYWTNMGVPNLPDGSIERADLDGANRTIVVPQGRTHTPKQLQLDKKGGKLYWCDREGMKVMRANLDGSGLETLVDTGDAAKDFRDQTRWCVGITLDYERGHLYWTQKGPDNAGLGRIYRANIEIPSGETAARRSDIEIWLDGLPEPIDIELDRVNRVLYWTDRGDPPNGNTVNRARIDAPASERTPQIVFTHLMEGIGIALDVPHSRMFMTDLGGSLYAARFDGTEQRTLLFAQGNLSGVAYAELP